MKKLIPEDTKQQRHMQLLQQLDPQFTADQDERDPPAWGSDPFDTLAQLEEEMGLPLNHQ